MIKQQDEPSPAITRTNFRYLGDLAPEESLWWREHGETMDRIRRSWDSRLPPANRYPR